MEKIKTFIIQRFNVLFYLFGVSLISMFLLMLRLKITQSFFFLFLVWNLFLAVIPIVITLYLSQKKQLKLWRFCLWFAFWLLFLPNAPYMITDAIHLRLSSGHLLIFDTILVGFFALSGLIYYTVSVNDMENILLVYFPKTTKYILFVIPFAVGFGIYLGRFLRWNSWDLLSKPQHLIRSLWDMISMPSEHILAWIITFSFGIFLSFCQLVFRRIKTNKDHTFHIL